MAGGTLFIAPLIALLAGCASEPPVRISAYRGDFVTGSVKTYALRASPSAAASNAAPGHWLDEALAAEGLRPASPGSADYLITLGYATRPQAVRVLATCTGAPESACDDVAAKTDYFADFFGRKRYLHALTVQFVERANGTVAYQVSVTHTDRDPAGNAALPGLVKCAFTGFPLQNAERRELARCD